MSFGDYLLGSIELIAVAAAMGFAAVGLRGRLLPGWSGASARLAEVVLGLSLLVVMLELVGVVGLYRPGWVLLAALIVGLGIGFALRPPPQGRGAAVAGGGSRSRSAVAVAAAFLVAAHWAMPTQTGLDIGMYLPNTTWHNAPFAARFVQDHQVGAIHFIETLNLTVWFYPQNSELLHSAGVLFLGNDFLSPLINIGWMSLCLLAAWAFARVYGGGPVAVLAMRWSSTRTCCCSTSPATPRTTWRASSSCWPRRPSWSMPDAQRRAAPSARPLRGAAGPGVLPTASTDRRGARRRPGARDEAQPARAVRPADARCDRGRRPDTAPGQPVVWVLSALVTGGFWFARNLVNAGNPLPWIKAGPLPGPDQADINIREPHNLAHYLLPPDGGVIRHHLVPGLHSSFGDLWPLVLAVFIGGFLLAIINGRTPLIRMLGVVALLSGIAYLFTPLTAAGPQGDPTAFTTNLRYASPAFGLGAMLLAVDPGLGRRRDQALAARHPGRAAAGPGGPGLGSLRSPVDPPLPGRGDRAGDLPDPRPGRDRARRTAWASRGSPLGGAVVLALALVVAIGWPKSDDYVKDRYQASTAPRRLPGRDEGGARLVQRGQPARHAHRRGRRPPRLQAVRLLRRRPLQPRPVHRPPRPAWRLPADCERGGAERPRPALDAAVRGVAPGRQRR